MDNGVGRGTWSAARQASTLRDLGYHGISYNYTTPAALEEWLAATAEKKLKIYGLYFPLQLRSDRALPAGLAEAITRLRGSGAALWTIIPNPGAPGDYEAEAIKGLQQLADLAAAAQLRVVLYPHKGFYLATAEHALALVQAVGRTNVGLTVNLAHELAAGNGARLPEIIRRVAPALERVTLNGATDKASPGWENYIKLLGTGDYDVGVVLKTLAAIRYAGPVGIQFYNVPGTPDENLTATIAAWRAMPAP